MKSSLTPQAAFLLNVENVTLVGCVIALLTISLFTQSGGGKYCYPSELSCTGIFDGMQQRQTTKRTIPEHYGCCYSTEFSNKTPQITLLIAANWFFFFFSRASCGSTSHEPSAVLQGTWDHILILLLRYCGFCCVEMKLASTSHKLQYSPYN